MSLSFCRRRLLQINVQHPTKPHVLQTLLLKSLSNLSASPNRPSLTLSYLMDSCGLSPESALHASKSINIKTPQKSDSVLQFLKTHGLSDAQIATLVTAAPRYLSADVGKTLQPKIDFFKGLGISGPHITDLITSDPGMLMRGLQTQIIPCMDFLKNLVHSNENAVKAFRRCRWMVTSDVKKKMQSNIALLKEHGVQDSQITDIAMLKPSVLAQKSDWLVGILQRVEEMGVGRGSSVFVTGLLALSSLKKSTLEGKLELLKSLGWSQGEISGTLRTMPSLLRYSEKKIRAGMDFYVNKLKWTPSEVASFPILLMFSLEERVVPKCKVWKMLKCEGLVEEGELKKMLLLSEKRFLKKYVTKYEKQVPSVLKVYEGELEFQLWDSKDEVDIDSKTAV